jgi:hypothetical protein
VLLLVPVCFALLCCVSDDSGLPAEDAALLFELQRIWEGKYKIKVDEHDGCWVGERVTGAKVIFADTGGQLRALLTNDAIRWNYEIWGRASSGPLPQPRNPL